jgi:hypothetical protein
MSEIIENNVLKRTTRISNTSTYLLNVDKSWTLLPDEYKYHILKSYNESLFNITGLFAGFQSFVIENSRKDGENTNQLSLLLLMISFGLNISTCLISLISLNLLNSGVYYPKLLHVNLVCVYSVIVSTCCFYTSLLIYTFDIFYNTELYYMIIACQTCFSIIAILCFMVWNEKYKYSVEYIQRMKFIDFSK